MRLLALLLLSLALHGLASAAEPTGSEQKPPVQGPSRASEASPPRPHLSPSTRQQLRDLDRRLSVLESLAVGRGHGRGVMERGLGWSPELKERGFFLYSTDGLFRLHLNGGIQAQYNAFPGGRTGRDPGTEPDGFEFRRVRPILDFRIGRFVRGQIMPDLAPRRRTELYNAFLDFELSELARLRVGQFKPALSLEKLQGEFDLVFAERSLVQNFVPFRDFGVQLTGRLFRQQLRYDMGAFNGSPQAIGPANLGAPSADNNKHLVARLMLTPFLLQGPRAFRQLEFGVGVMYGAFTNTAGQQPMLTMGQDRIIFQYQDTVTGNGFHTRIVPQMSWFWGRLGVMSLFVHTWEPKINRATGLTGTVQNEAWMVQGEFALTDDEPAFIRVTPKRPFNPARPLSGNWGAWTIAARYSEQRVDPQAFGLGFASAQLYAQTAKGTSVALNWYASREFRLQGIWEHTDFFGATPAFSASNRADLLIVRFTLIY
ncbi:MAG: porin [Nitrospirota bacterium]